MTPGPGTPEEFKKGHYTLGFVIYAFAIGITLGGFGIGLYLSLAEVGGVRSDFEKEDRAIHLEIDRLREDMRQGDLETHEHLEQQLEAHNKAADAHDRLHNSDL